MIGQTLGHYSILKKLGEGGMGAVYLAEDSRLNRKIALKVLPKEMAEEPERIRRFEREAKLVANLNHPNIVTLFSVEEVDGTRFITMELVEGKTLAELMTDEGMAAADFVRLAIPMAEALAAAHEKGIAHRDLKPANIMVTNDQRVKILDFGVAKLQDGAADLLGPGMQTVTQEGSFVGTVAYMAPEQARGSAPDLRADLFSLGIVLYETATGRRPFEGETSIEVVSNILREEPPPVSDVKVDLPHDLGRIIERCLEKDPESRYQNASELLKDLRQLRRAIDLGTATIGEAVGKADSTVVLSGPMAIPEAEAAQSAAKRPPLLWIGGAAAALAIAGVIYLATRSGEPAVEPAAAPAPEVETAEQPAPLPLQDTLVAVRPLETIGGGGDEAFSLGLTDDVATRLTSLGKLQVLSRGRIESIPASATASEIGAELGAGHVLAGSIRWGGSPETGRRVRVNLRLVHAADGIQVWSELFDREVTDSLTVQADIARAVARGVGIALLGSIPPDIAASWDDEESLEVDSEPEATLVEAIPQLVSAPAYPAVEPAPQRVATAEPPTPATETPSASSAAPPTAAPDRAPAAQSTPRPQTTAPAVTGEGTLVIEFNSEAPDGELKIFADDSLLFEREFTGRRKGFFGKAKRTFKTSAPDFSFLSERTVSRSLTEVEVVVEMEGLPLNRQKIRLDYGKTHKYKLKIDVDRDGGVTIQPLFARPR